MFWRERDGQKGKEDLLREFSDNGGPWRESLRQATKLVEYHLDSFAHSSYMRSAYESILPMLFVPICPGY